MIERLIWLIDLIAPVIKLLIISEFGILRIDHSFIAFSISRKLVAPAAVIQAKFKSFINFILHSVDSIFAAFWFLKFKVLISEMVKLAMKFNAEWEMTAFNWNRLAEKERIEVGMKLNEMKIECCLMPKWMINEINLT